MVVVSMALSLATTREPAAASARRPMHPTFIHMSVTHLLLTPDVFGLVEYHQERISIQAWPAHQGSVHIHLAHQPLDPLRGGGSPIQDVRPRRHLAGSVKIRQGIMNQESKRGEILPTNVHP